MRYTHEQNGGVVNSATDHEFSYDAPWSTTLMSATYTTGRLSVATTPTETIGFSYDGYGNVNQRQFVDNENDENPSYVDRQLFHGDGSRYAIELDLPDNEYQAENVYYEYDTAGLLRSMQFSDGRELYKASTVDDWGRVLDASLGPTNVTSTFSNTAGDCRKHSKRSRRAARVVPPSIDSTRSRARPCATRSRRARPVSYDHGLRRARPSTERDSRVRLGDDSEVVVYLRRARQHDLARRSGEREPSVVELPYDRSRPDGIARKRESEHTLILPCSPRLLL